MLVIPRSPFHAGVASSSLEIDWDNPLTQGLVFAAYPLGNSFYDAVSKEFGTVSGTVDFRGQSTNEGLFGHPYAHVGVANDAAGGRVTWPKSKMRGGTMVNEATILVLGGSEQKISGASYTIAGNWDEVSSGNGFSIHIDDTYYWGAGYVVKGTYGGFYGVTSAQALGSSFSNKLHFFGYSARNNGTDGNWFFNRQAEAYTGKTAHGTTTTNRQAVVCGYTGSADRPSICGLALFWERELSLAEYQALYDDPWQIFDPEVFSIPLAPAGALTGTVNQVTETDTAQAISWAPKRRIVNQTSEADTAQAITIAKSLGVGQVSETDLAQAISVGKRLAVGQATEIDLAQPITASNAKVIAVGQAAETDLAQAILWAPKIRVIGIALESDTAQPITAIGGQAVVVETVTPGWEVPYRVRRVPSQEEQEARVLRQRQDFGVLPATPQSTEQPPLPEPPSAGAQEAFGEHPPQEIALPVNVVAIEARRKAQNEAMLLLLMAA